MDRWNLKLYISIFSKSIFRFSKKDKNKCPKMNRGVGVSKKPEIVTD